jgi:hypothetical protein
MEERIESVLAILAGKKHFLSFSEANIVGTDSCS